MSGSEGHDSMLAPLGNLTRVTSKLVARKLFVHFGVTGPADVPRVLANYVLLLDTHMHGQSDSPRATIRQLIGVSRF